MRLFAFVVTVLSATALSAGVIGECRRSPGDSSLSGIASVGDGTYWAVCDDGHVVRGRVGFESGGRGGPTSWTRLDRFKCREIDDSEGIAYDRSDGTLWVSDETGPEIWHVDPKVRRVVGKVTVPAVFRTAEPNRGFEALAIADDALTMWTANEAELPGDADTDCVRLQRFSRPSVTNEWRASGQWAYRLTPDTEGKRKRKSRSGLAELCVSPTGGLLALEREQFKGRKAESQFRLRLFRIVFEGATDVSGTASLRSGGFTPVRKVALCDMPTWNARYEAICVGPKRADGSDCYLLVSDGDKDCDEKVMLLSVP